MAGQQDDRAAQDPADEREQDEEEGGKRRRLRVLWSSEEEAKLIELVKLHGRGNWATILKQGAVVFNPVRTNVDMKDKWYNLDRKGAIDTQTEQEIEAREAELADQLRAERRPGRPPRFVTPKPKRPRLAASEDEDEDGEVDDDEESAEAILL